MPLYDVQCPTCKKVTEVFCSYEDRNSTVCEECKELMLTIPSRTTAVFKGSGFYCNDYKSPTLPTDYSYDNAKPNIVKPGDYG